MTTQQLKTAIVLIFLGSNLSIWAVGEPAFVMSLGDIKSIQSNNQTIFYNPANTLPINNRSVGIGYSNRFCIKELSTSYLYATAGTKAGTFNAGFARFGNQLYNSNKVVIGYTNRWNRFSAGVNFNYLAISIIGSKLGQMIYSQIGIKAYLTENFTTSFSATNLEQSAVTIDNNTTTIPTEILLGLKWTDKKYLTLYLEAEKNLNSSFVAKCAAEILPSKYFAVRVGCYNTPLSPTAGIGLKLDGFTIDLGIDYNTTLGISSSISLSISF